MSALLELSRLRKSFGGLLVADDVSLELSPGERVALIGPNGAGKTTLVDLVSGRLSADAGTIAFAGEDITRLDAVGRVRRGLVRSFQVSRLFAEETPLDHLLLAILRREGRAMRVLGSPRADPAHLAEAEGLLETLGLHDLAGRRVSELAYGQQRLLELALALALKPRVLLLDEPGAGVPQGEAGRIEAALGSLPEDLAVLMIDHDMDLVFRFARRVVVLAAGTVVFDGAPGAAAADRRVRQAYLGRSLDDGRSA